MRRVIESFALGTVRGDYKPRYNAAPSQLVPVIRVVNGKREMVMLRWGLLPPNARDESEGKMNARAETVDVKPSFARAFRSQRCLIPADGFYEWLKVGGKKFPYHFTLAKDQVFAFAGLWETWHEI